MIVVTLGTHPQPMDRLVRRLDELVDSGAIDEQVVLQTPALGYRPMHLEMRGVVPYGELSELLARADVVISHAVPRRSPACGCSAKSP